MTRWVAMVQKEVGERFAAAPGSGAYGVPSVLAQLACEVRVLRAVSRTVFLPVPERRLGARRPRRARGPAPAPALRALVQRRFAHRRKALARSLALAPARAPGRDRVRAALDGARPSGRRARRAPRAGASLRELREALGRVTGAARPPRQGQPLPVRRAGRARTAATSS